MPSAEQRPIWLGSPSTVSPGAQRPPQPHPDHPQPGLARRSPRPGDHQRQGTSSDLRKKSSHRDARRHRRVVDDLLEDPRTHTDAVGHRGMSRWPRSSRTAASRPAPLPSPGSTSGFHVSGGPPIPQRLVGGVSGPAAPRSGEAGVPACCRRSRSSTNLVEPRNVALAVLARRSASRSRTVTASVPVQVSRALADTGGGPAGGARLCTRSRSNSASNPQPTGRADHGWNMGGIAYLQPGTGGESPCWFLKPVRVLKSRPGPHRSRAPETPPGRGPVTIMCPPSASRPARATAPAAEEAAMVKAGACAGRPDAPAFIGHAAR